MPIKKHSIDVYNHKGEWSIMEITRDIDPKYPLGYKELSRVTKRKK